MLIKFEMRPLSYVAKAPRVCVCVYVPSSGERFRMIFLERLMKCILVWSN